MQLVRGAPRAACVPGRSRQPCVAVRATAVQDAPPAAPPAPKLTGPAPQRFAVAAGQETVVARAAAGSLLRLASGTVCLGYTSGIAAGTPADAGTYALLTDLPGGLRSNEGSTVSRFPRPAEPLELYAAQDAEGKKVREALSILDLPVMFYPCPAGGSAHSAALTARAAAAPLLIDSTRGLEVTGGDAIVAHLFRNYGNNRPPAVLAPGPLNDLTAAAAVATRGGAGATYTGDPAKRPAAPLEYWGYEGSPFCVLVQEALAELDLPHLFRPVARGSPSRQELLQRRGHFQVPYIEDPNTGAAMFESAAIVEYLRATYGA